MTWNIDQTHSEVQFKVKHLVISTVTGSFTNFDGNIIADSEENFDNSKVTFSIDVNSIATNQVDRDNHLKSAEFFDAESFPKISFADGIFSHKNDHEYDLTGNLTIKETTLPIVLKASLGGIVVDPYGNTKAGFEINGSLNRKDFGMTWNAITEAGGLLVGEEIKLLFNLQFSRV